MQKFVPWTKGAFTYYVSSPRGGRGFGLKLTFAYGGGRGVHGQAYVSIGDLEITIYEEFSRELFGSNEFV